MQIDIEKLKELFGEILDFVEGEIDYQHYKPTVKKCPNPKCKGKKRVLEWDLYRAKNLTWQCYCQNCHVDLPQTNIAEEFKERFNEILKG